MGIVWCIVWLWSTIPPTFYDELAYHLPIAQYALRTGSLPALPWSFFTYMPHLSDLLLGWGLAIGGDVGTRSMHLVFWVVIWIAGWAFVEATPPGSTSLDRLRLSWHLRIIFYVPFSRRPSVCRNIAHLCGFGICRSDCISYRLGPLASSRATVGARHFRQALRIIMGNCWSTGGPRHGMATAIPRQGRACGDGYGITLVGAGLVVDREPSISPWLPLAWRSLLERGQSSATAERSPLIT